MTFGDPTRAINHMNVDHASSILAYAHYYGGKPNAQEAQLTGANEVGFTILVDVGKEIKFRYPEVCEVKTSKDLRKVAVFMHREAFNGLGFVYKWNKGYYGDVAKILWSIAKKKGIVSSFVGLGFPLLLAFAAKHKAIKK